MALSPGTRLGSYEIAARIGVGGMGEVYRATDTRLKRDVAIKVLPGSLLADADRLTRFQREAEVLASLNHPNIAAIYGLEESADTKAIVMELVEGPTLADRIVRGALSLDEALPIATQIAEALEAAHERGVIHRDLKPANVKVREDGTVKVLDFGLAKALDPTREPDSTHSPTMTGATQLGAILGTAAYMSPEQAAGKPSDKRTDIWSFGVVLFEMLAGRRPFTGETMADVLASVLRTDPDWTLLPPAVPVSLRRLLRRCLQRDRRNRLHDIADVRLELAEIQAMVTEPRHEVGVTPSLGRRFLVSTTAGLLAGSVVTVLLIRAWLPSASSQVTRTTIDAPGLTVYSQFGGVSVSPDGTTVVFVGRREDGMTQLYRRPLDRFIVEPIVGTEGANGAFFSPDGQWIAFGQGEALMKVRLAGGEPSLICNVQGRIRGVTWGADNSMIFGDYEGLSSVSAVSATGCQRRSVATMQDGETAYRDPHFLPDSKAVLFTIVRAGQERVAVRSLETGAQHELVDGWEPHYLATGHLLFARQDSLWAVPLDVSRLALAGEPLTVLDKVHTRPVGSGRYTFDVSHSGVMVFAPAHDPTWTLVRVNIRGEPTPLFTVPVTIFYPRIAPNGRAVAIGYGLDINVIDNVDAPERMRMRQLTSNDSSGNGFPFAWSDDSSEMMYTASDQQSFFRIRTDGSRRQAEPVFRSEFPAWPTSWRAGKVLFHQNHTKTERDVWTWDPDEGAKPFVRERFRERSASFSPDGKWVVYVSNESQGRDEVYVQPYPGPGPQKVVSNGGGTEPVWAPDGRQIFYRSLARMMMVVDVTTEPFEVPRPLFDSSRFAFDRGAAGSNPEYDVFADGSLVMIEVGAPPPRLNVIVNWHEELKRLLGPSTP